jgi:hypothetical protein
MLRNGLVGTYDEVVPRQNRVEVRSAFVDRGLFEFVQTIPPPLRGSEARRPLERKLLRAAFAEVMPVVAQRRGKSALPAFPWWSAFKHLEPLVLGQVERCKENGVFSPDAVEKLLRKYRRRGNERDRERVWSLFVFQTWFDFWVLGSKPFLETE